jgi:hypothetical protein
MITERDCVACGKGFRGRYRKCYECRAADRSCTACGTAFRGTNHLCAQCTRAERQCITCGKSFRSRYRECRRCRAAKVAPQLCQVTGCGNLKVQGQGSKLCQEHRDDAYQRKLEHLRKAAEEPCRIPGCPVPKLPGRFRYCAQHCYSADGRHRESMQVVNRKRERKHGVGYAEYLAMLDAQGGVCAICGGTTQRGLSLDHDHATGQVRGLLCDRCNPMLGYARDDIAVLQAAIEYLAKWSGIQTAPLRIPLHFRGSVPS